MKFTLIYNKLGAPSTSFKVNVETETSVSNLIFLIDSNGKSLLLHRLRLDHA